jgi:hypothetical protein
MRSQVVIVTRNDSEPVLLPLRKLSASAEKSLQAEFLQQWADMRPSSASASVTICCDFSLLSSVDHFIEFFYDADICIGLFLYL